MPRDKDTSKLLTEIEAAEYLGLTYHQLAHWRRKGREGRPLHRDIGRRIMYTRKSLDEWLERQG